MKKLGVIVPYRNRPEHLEEFKRRITRYLNRFEDIPYELIIINQDDAKQFNMVLFFMLFPSYSCS